MFLAASARPAGERAGFVAEACAGDSALQREVQSLLDEATSPTLEQAPLAALAEAMGDTSGHDRRGTLIGGYQLAERIGAGGMGEVYRARDTRLGRDVAIKILPAVFTSDHDRQQRFEREARVLASLNHPNIAALYGFAEQPATESEPELKALVLELVEGETLAARIERSTMPLDNALTVARQIADALEAAHAKGIVHRDLKPANVVIADSGLVKVLDFGLAKPMAPAGGDAERPPPSGIGSREGAIIGTAAYMSPEQARGLPVDTRSDIWAFGCVLYEMLTGQQAFRGQTASDTIAAILGREADWSALPPGTPASVIQLLRRCLEKDLKRRLHHIADARIDIDDVLDGQTAVSAFVTGRDRRAARLPWLVSAARECSPVGSSVHCGWPSSSPRLPVPASGRRAAMSVPARRRGRHRDRLHAVPNRGRRIYSVHGPPLALSPDGRNIVYVGAKAEGPTQLWLRSLYAQREQALPGTEGAKTPFWSSDSQWIGFSAANSLKKVRISSGLTQVIATNVQNKGGAAWNADDVIVFQDFPGGLSRVSAQGGQVTPVITGAGSQFWPQFLGDGLHFIYADSVSRSIRIASLNNDGPRTLMTFPVRISSLAYVPGYIFFVQDASLFARPFDEKRLSLPVKPSGSWTEFPSAVPDAHRSRYPPQVCCVLAVSGGGPDGPSLVREGRPRVLPGGEPDGPVRRLCAVARCGTARVFPCRKGRRRRPVASRCR